MPPPPRDHEGDSYHRQPVAGGVLLYIECRQLDFYVLFIMLKLLSNLTDTPLYPNNSKQHLIEEKKIVSFSFLLVRNTFYYR